MWPSQNFRPVPLLVILSIAVFNNVVTAKVITTEKAPDSKLFQYGLGVFNSVKDTFNKFLADDTTPSTVASKQQQTATFTTATTTENSISLSDEQCDAALSQCSLFEIVEKEYQATWRRKYLKAEVQSINSKHRATMLRLKIIINNLIDAVITDPSAASLLRVCDDTQGLNPGLSGNDDVTSSPVKLSTTKKPKPITKKPTKTTPRKTTTIIPRQPVTSTAKALTTEAEIVNSNETTIKTNAFIVGSTTRDLTSLSSSETTVRHSQGSSGSETTIKTNASIVGSITSAPTSLSPSETTMRHSQGSSGSETTGTISVAPPGTSTTSKDSSSSQSTAKSTAPTQASSPPVITTETVPPSTASPVCIVNAWSDWSAPFGFGVQERKREVIEPGVECPEANNLLEQRNGTLATDDNGDFQFEDVEIVSQNFQEDFIQPASGKPRDLLLVIDSSGSISEDDFAAMKEGVKILIDVLCGGFGSNNTNNRLSIVQFSSSSVGVLTFGQNQSPAKLKAVVDSLQLMYGYTCTGSALELAYIAFDPKYGSRNYTVHDTLLITDGQSNCGPNLLQASLRLQQRSNVFALALGLGGDPRAASEIQSVVSSSDPHHLFSLANYHDFHVMAKNIQENHDASQCQEIETGN